MEQEGRYEFQLLKKKLPSFDNTDFKELLTKWNLDLGLHVWSFSFNKAYYHNPKEFVHSLLTDPTVMHIMTPSVATWDKSLSIESVKAKHLNCSLTSMKFFDRLTEENIVRESGYIMKCFDTVFEGITIADELRKMLIDDDSVNFDVYSEDERDEVMFRLFKAFVIGGPICQYEDEIKPYLDITKSFYKDLVCVQKSVESEEIKVVSEAFDVKILDERSEAVFPRDADHQQSFAYVIIDPVKRHVHLVHHSSAAKNGFW